MKKILLSILMLVPVGIIHWFSQNNTISTLALQSIATTTSPVHHMIDIDLNLDGNNDLVWIDDTFIRAAFGNSSQSYNSPVTLYTSNQTMYSMVVTHANYDSYPDIAVAGIDGLLVGVLQGQINTVTYDYSMYLATSIGEGLAHPNVLLNSVDSLNRGVDSLVVTDLVANTMTNYVNGIAMQSRPISSNVLLAFIDVDNDYVKDTLAISTLDQSIRLIPSTNGLLLNSTSTSSVIASDQAFTSIRSFDAIDFDHDGDDDLLVLINGSESIQLWIGENSNGVFTPTLIDLNLNSLSSFIWDDVNEDGRIELIYANSDLSTISYQSISEELTLSSPTVLVPSTGLITQIIKQNTTSNYEFDLFVIEPFEIKKYTTQLPRITMEYVAPGATVDSSYEKQSNIYSSQSQSSSFATSYQINPLFLKSYDTNRDGHSDYYSINGNSMIVLNRGSDSGIYSSISTNIYYSLGYNEPYSYQLIDVDQDGYLDLVKKLDSSLNWWRNDHSGLFEDAETISITAGVPLGKDFTMSDIDHDGKLELISFYNQSSTSQMYIFTQDAGGTSYTRETTYRDIPYSFAESIFHDYDHDGDDDLFVRSWNSVYLYKNVLGALTSQPEFIHNDAQRNISTMKLADVNQDGIDDVVLGINSYGIVYYPSNRSAHIAWNSSYSDAFTTIKTINTNGYFYPSLVLSDIEKDGDIDVLFTYGQNDIFAIQMMTNQGDGVFASATMQSSNLVGSSAMYIVDGDFNNDQTVDFIKVLSVANSSTRNMFYAQGSIGVKLESLARPSKQGYTFENWFSDDQFVNIFVDYGTVKPFGTSHRIYAKFVLTTYYINFSSNSGSYVASLSGHVGDELLQPDDPLRTGYSFAGWYSDSSLTNPYIWPTTFPSSNTYLYAKWILNNYTLSFEENGGPQMNDIVRPYGASISYPNMFPTRNGYSFNGWYLDNQFTTSFNQYSMTTMPGNNLTIYAKWTALNQNIYLNTNGGQYLSNITGVTGSTIELPTPIKTGYTFNGWYSDSSLQTEFTSTVMPGFSNNYGTLYAKWSVGSYLLNINTNGGSSINPMTFTYQATLSNIDIPTRNGYSFDGYYTDSNLTNPLGNSTMPGNDLTIYAKWRLVTYRITLHPNLGLITAGEVIYSIEDDTIILENPSRQGYIFAGWFDNSDFLGNVYVEIDSATLTEYSLYAKWQLGLYSITYFPNNGLTIQPSIIPYGEIIPALPTPIRGGYQFDGWYLENSLTNQFSYSAMPAHPIEVYAKWRDIEPPVVSGVNHLETYAANTELTILFNEGTATLNGDAFASGAIISESGNYTLIVTDDEGNQTYLTFTIAESTSWAWIIWLIVLLFTAGLIYVAVYNKHLVFNKSKSSNNPR